MGDLENLARRSRDRQLRVITVRPDIFLRPLRSLRLIIRHLSVGRPPVAPPYFVTFVFFVVKSSSYTNRGLISFSRIRDCSRGSSDAMRAMIVVSPAAA